MHIIQSKVLTGVGACAAFVVVTACSEPGAEDDSSAGTTSATSSASDPTGGASGGSSSGSTGDDGIESTSTSGPATTVDGTDGPSDECFVELDFQDYARFEGELQGSSSDYLWVWDTRSGSLMEMARGASTLDLVTTADETPHLVDGNAQIVAWALGTNGLRVFDRTSGATTPVQGYDVQAVTVAGDEVVFFHAISLIEHEMYVRRGDGGIELLANTAGARGAAIVDEWIVFHDASAGELRRMPLVGGEAETIAPLDNAASEVVVAGNHAFVEISHDSVRSIALDTGEVVTAEEHPNIDPGIYYGGLWPDGDWVYWLRESQADEPCAGWVMRAQGGSVAEPVMPLTTVPSWYYDRSVFDGHYHRTGFGVSRAPLP